jgi:hypothetical protein
MADEPMTKLKKSETQRQSLERLLAAERKFFEDRIGSEHEADEADIEKVHVQVQVALEHDAEGQDIDRRLGHRHACILRNVLRACRLPLSVGPRAGCSRSWCRRRPLLSA